MNFLKQFLKKPYIFCSFFLIMTTASFSQIQDPVNNFWDNVRFGGGLGLSFGDGFFSGTIAPAGIYEFNTKFAAGVGLNFTYTEEDNFYKSTIFGGSILGLYSPIRELQFSSELELLNVSRNFESDSFIDDNYFYPALFMGLGYSNGNVTFGIRYDVLYDRDQSIYADPWAPFVRVFF